jgi:glycosyltransferase involved in cell wall biosynthesis
MSKRILILCEAIAPPSFSPRILTLIEWLQQNGWQCTLVTEECEEQVFHTDICPTYQMPTYNHILLDKLCWGKDKALYHYAKQMVDMSTFDMIFCSSYYYFPLYAAHLLAQEYYIPLAIDLRDIAEQWGDTVYFTRKLTPFNKLNYWIGKIYEHRQLRVRNRILRNASIVTSVSPWHQNVLAKYNANTHLIYNGYDAKVFVPKDIACDCFYITYLGKLYSTQLRDPRLLFEALRQLIQAKQIDAQAVCVRFHTDPKGIQEIHKVGEQYQITDILDINGYIPRQDILPVMHSSSILLVLTTLSTPNGTHGIMGTKFFENIGVEKPILCVRSDEECLADAIEKTNAGLAATNVEEVKAFILEKYHEWQQNGFTRQRVVNKEQFTRQHEAAQFEQLFIETLKH